MKITKLNPLTGTNTTLDIDITQEQYLRWKKGELIQRVAPHLSEDDREFLISGIPPGEFDKLFPDEDKDEPDFDVWNTEGWHTDQNNNYDD